MPPKPTRDIVLSVELDATPEEVFRAVTDGTEIAKWLAPEARSTPPQGDQKGTIWISWGEGMSAEHEIEIYDAPRHVRHPSGQTGEAAPLFADWWIETGAGGQTVLRLVHSGFDAGADWDDEYNSHARGWSLMLTNLRHYFARHRGQPTAHVAFMDSIEQPRPALWAKLLGALGFAASPQVGDAYRLTTPDGAVLTGTVDFVRDGFDLGLVVRERDDALLRFNLLGKADAPATFVYGYSIAYGDQRPCVAELNASVPLR
ncbi:MAG: SRPBCC domain-containing protein [Verrucomicrobia bacterium]|nr:SRPBCC domain-containing protein [Verrucomicrobiota bacterium]